MRRPIKVLIAEDNYFIRLGLRQVIGEVQTLQLSGEAENDEELLQLAPIIQPHVIVTGIHVPATVLQQGTLPLATDHPGINIIVFSDCKEAQVITAITGAGAAGYVMKSSDGRQMVNAIEAAYHNRNYYCDNTLKVLKAAAALPRIPNAAAWPQEALTARERQVMWLLCDEKSTRQIGVRLQLSERTIEGHRQEILRKTQSVNLAGVIKYALRHDLYLLSVYVFGMMIEFGESYGGA